MRILQGCKALADFPARRAGAVPTDSLCSVTRRLHAMQPSFSPQTSVCRHLLTHQLHKPTYKLPRT